MLPERMRNVLVVDPAATIGGGSHAPEHRCSDATVRDAAEELVSALARSIIEVNTAGMQALAERMLREVGRQDVTVALRRVPFGVPLRRRPLCIGLRPKARFK